MTLEQAAAELREAVRESVEVSRQLTEAQEVLDRLRIASMNCHDRVMKAQERLGHVAIEQEPVTQ